MPRVDAVALLLLLLLLLVRLSNLNKPAGRALPTTTASARGCSKRSQGTDQVQEQRGAGGASPSDPWGWPRVRVEPVAKVVAWMGEGTGTGNRVFVACTLKGSRLSLTPMWTPPLTPSLSPWLGGLLC